MENGTVLSLADVGDRKLLVEGVRSVCAKQTTEETRKDAKNVNLFGLILLGIFGLLIHWILVCLMQLFRQH